MAAASVGLTALSLLTMSSRFRDWVIRRVGDGSFQGCHQMVFPAIVTLLLALGALWLAVSSYRAGTGRAPLAVVATLFAVPMAVVAAGFALASAFGMFCYS
jgi:uncharacterized membrane protein